MVDSPDCAVVASPVTDQCLGLEGTSSLRIRCDCRSALDVGPESYTGRMAEDRIVADHRIMGGVPCIRGTRIPVATIVGLIAEGYSVEGVVADYPQLVTEDVRASLAFAAAAVSERQLPLRTPA